MSGESQLSGASSDARHIYFYIPKTVAGNPANNSALGTVLRLGGYTDDEANVANQTSTVEGQTVTTKVGLDDKAAEIYPPQHVTDEGSNASRHAAGVPHATSQGILLTCDGRILVRSGEKTYIHSGDDLDIQSGKKISMKAGGGRFDVKSSKKVSIHSGINAAAKPDRDNGVTSNTTGTSGVEIIAANGSGNIFIEATDLYLSVNGTSTSTITADNTTIMRANDFQDIKGKQTNIFRGGSRSLYFGGSAELRFSVSFTLSAAIDVEVSLMSIGYTQFDLSITGVDHSMTLKELRTKLFASKVSAAETNQVLNQVDTVATLTENSAIVTENAIFEAGTTGGRSESVGASNTIVAVADNTM